MREFIVGEKYVFVAKKFKKDNGGKLGDHKEWVNRCNGEVFVACNKYDSRSKEGFSLNPEWCKRVIK